MPGGATANGGTVAWHGGFGMGVLARGLPPPPREGCAARTPGECKWAFREMELKWAGFEWIVTVSHLRSIYMG